MRIFTLRLFQFACGASLATILFRYTLNLCINLDSQVMPVLCSIAYFACMFLCGWHLGRKDEIENDIHDIGFRFHAVTYIICIGISFISHYSGWETETLKSITITALCWGALLLVHFIVFLLEQRKTIKGYSKDNLFE